MKTRTIEVNVEFVIAALESRYEDVKELWGNLASESLWEQALSLVEEAGLGSNITSPSVYVDNYLINGEFYSKSEDFNYWLSETSKEQEYEDIIEQVVHALHLNEDELESLNEDKKRIINEAWNEYCQDNALIYNDEYACLQF